MMEIRVTKEQGFLTAKQSSMNEVFHADNISANNLTRKEDNISLNPIRTL